MKPKQGRLDVFELMQQREGFRIAQGYENMADDETFEDVDDDLFNMDVEFFFEDSLDDNVPSKGEPPITE